MESGVRAEPKWPENCPFATIEKRNVFLRHYTSVVSRNYRIVLMPPDLGVFGMTGTARAKARGSIRCGFNETLH